MSAAPGWYPDPGGQVGLFRYWDGGSWSTSTTANPYVGPPAQPVGPGPAPTRPPRRSPIGWILGGVALLVVAALVVVGVLVLRRPDVTPTGEPPDSSTGPTAVQCPPAPSARPTTAPDARAERVTSGHLSYPRLSAPFGVPITDSRVPFGRDTRSQAALVQRTPDGKAAWVAAVLISRLLAGDGFYGPQQGAAVVAGCVIGTFYGDNPVDRKDVSNQATTVDGHRAWLIEMHLTFDIPGIQAKGEMATIVVVDTGAADGEAGLFYSSIPDTSPQFTAPAANALQQLQVS